MDSYSVNFRVKKRWVRTATVVLVTAMIVAPITAYAIDRFTDVPDSNTFHDNITWLADAGVTLGCNPPANTQYCPSDEVTRGQMAAFLQRLAENQVVDAGALGGENPNHYERPVAVATGSFLDGTDFASQSGSAATATLTAPEAGVFVVNTTSSWDIGAYVVVTWVEMDTGTPCNTYTDGDAIPGTLGVASGDSVDAGVAWADTSAGTGWVTAAAAGTHDFHHCVLTFSGTSDNLDHSISVAWYPSAAADVASSPAGSGNGGAAPGGIAEG